MYVLNLMFHIQEISYLVLDVQLNNGSKYQMDLTQKNGYLSRTSIFLIPGPLVGPGCGP